MDDLPYSAPEQRSEAVLKMGRMSIQGVQPKLSAVLNTRKNSFEIVEINGRFIIKPQHEIYAQMPENEDLTMKMAAITGVETPLHGLIWCKDGSLSYFIKRFDRTGREGKFAVEDFAQLAGLSRDTKYDYTIEKAIKLIESNCTFPVVEKYKFFRLVLFCFLTGNEDMHLKNFSVITRNGKIELAPAYDLLNSTLVMGGAEEEMALMLAGKRKEFRKRELIDYFGKEKLLLPDKAVDNLLGQFEKALPLLINLIDSSFLEQKTKEQYKDMVKQRFDRLLVF
ncbi:MAG TPA: HipA domain-containing protein [Flavilitoribacter sp.]|nr:HipA domain-containing protein [Flavilitoribacter sp.]HMQ88819.1 HipA domain-containing protein [Flavilitoribacter sp.]